MVNVWKTGTNLLRYRGGLNQWAWAINRVAGLGVVLFLGLHIVDIFVVVFGATLFNNLLFLYKGPPARLLEVFLSFGLLYHGLNGLRTIASDFIPRLAILKFSRVVFYLQLVIFGALFLPASFFMMWTLPQQPFHHNIWIAIGTMGAVLLLPVIVVYAGQLKPFLFMPGGATSDANYEAVLTRSSAASKKADQSRIEFYIWLFMRISGIFLIALALFHMFWLHMVIGVENISFDTIVQRWNDPLHPTLDLFWRSYDLALLAFAFTHGILGANYSVRDYVQTLRTRKWLQVGLILIWIVLFLMGAGIIFFFHGKLA